MSKSILEYEIDTEPIDTTTVREMLQGDQSFVKGVARIYHNGIETDINQLKEEIYPVLERGKRYRFVLEEMQDEK